MTSRLEAGTWSGAARKKTKRREEKMSLKEDHLVRRSVDRSFSVAVLTAALLTVLFARRDCARLLRVLAGGPCCA